MHIHKNAIVSATTEADVASLNTTHKCSACSREFTKQCGLRIHMARWCDGGRRDYSALTPRHIDQQSHNNGQEPGC